MPPTSSQGSTPTSPATRPGRSTRPSTPTTPRSSRRCGRRATAGLDWYLFDLGGLLDSLASKRYLTDPAARPSWWQEYPLPEPLKALDPVPNTRFFRSGPQGRLDGGLFSLDGVHPTTIGYGIVAQEVIKVMQRAGVAFSTPTGDPRPGGVTVDWKRLLATDTLISSPPALLDDGLGLLGWLDERLDWVRHIMGG